MMVLRNRHGGVGRLGVDPRLLGRVGFTDHAVARFAQRAGLAVGAREIVEPVMRGLLAREGLIREDRPSWAPSRNTAEFFLQLGEWMVFPIVTDWPRRRWDLSALTAINESERHTWRHAAHHGLIATAPPRALITAPPRPRLLASAIVAIKKQGSGLPAVARISAVHDARRVALDTQWRHELAVALQQLRPPDRH